MTTHVLEETLEDAIAMPPELAEALARFQEAHNPEPPAPPPPKTRVVVKRALPDREILTAMAGLATILTMRSMLLAAGIGAFVLATRAMSSGDPMSLAVLGVYCLAVLGPMVWLSTKRL